MRAGAMTCGIMKKSGDYDWIFPVKRDGEEEELADPFYRLVIKASAEVSLERIFDLTDDRDILYYACSAELMLEKLYDICEAVIARHEARGSWDRFRLIHRQLAGLAVEFGTLAARRPEQACNAFKAEQLNRILRPLKEQMEEDMGVSLSLVDGDGSLSYSDVAVILRTYLDVSAAYVHRHFDGNHPVIPPVPANWSAKLIQNQILMYCMDEPRGILEIAGLLGYKDKKTVRKYLNPLLDEGLIARTVPDRPNSRNQKYITAREK